MQVLNKETASSPQSQLLTGDGQSTTDAELLSVLFQRGGWVRPAQAVAQSVRHAVVQGHVLVIDPGGRIAFEVGHAVRKGGVASAGRPNP